VSCLYLQLLFVAKHVLAQTYQCKVDSSGYPLLDAADCLLDSSRSLFLLCECVGGVFLNEIGYVRVPERAMYQVLKWLPISPHSTSYVLLRM